jgi:hypothetical protein
VVHDPVQAAGRRLTFGRAAAGPGSHGEWQREHPGRSRRRFGRLRRIRTSLLLVALDRFGRPYRSVVRIAAGGSQRPPLPE